MKLINCSKYSDGQGAFKNGMHDHIGGLRGTDNLYRQGRWNKFAWRCGWLFQRATGLGYCEDSNWIRMARKYSNDYRIARHAAEKLRRQRDEQAKIIAELRAKIARVEALATDSRDERHGPGGCGIYAAHIEEALR